MKALSIRQPWTHMILHHGKRIENRTWSTSFRGEFFLHASKGMTRAEYEGALEVLDDVNGLQPVDVIPTKSLQRGGIIGVARLVGVVPPRKAYCPDGIQAHYQPGLDWRWHMSEQFGFVLADVRATPFVPCAGALGFFEVPASAERQARGLP